MENLFVVLAAVMLIREIRFEAPADPGAAVAVADLQLLNQGQSVGAWEPRVPAAACSLQTGQQVAAPRAAWGPGCPDPAAPLALLPFKKTAPGTNADDAWTFDGAASSMRARGARLVPGSPATLPRTLGGMFLAKPVE